MGTILSRLKGRKVEIQEYMKKIANPKAIQVQMESVFARLKTIPLNQKLLQLADSISESIQSKSPGEEDNKDFELTNYIPQYDTLFSFVNSEQVEELKGNALKHHKELEALFNNNNAATVDEEGRNDQQSGHTHGAHRDSA